MMSPDAMASKGEKTRSDIIVCAKNLFYQRGYEATSFTDIVNASGFFRGNIYHYFKTKDEILEAVIQQRQTDIRTGLAYWDAQYADPKARLNAFVSMVARSSELTEYGCPIGSLNTELGKERRELQDEARVLFDLFRHWLAQQFVALGYEDKAETMSLHLLGRAQGIAVIAQVYHDADVLKRETQMLAEWVREL
jgi:AcrR family transcriptional regulator